MGNDTTVCCQTFEPQFLYEIPNPFKFKKEEDSPFYEVVYHETGVVYRGQLKGGVPHGKGVQIHPDGDVYEGGFVNGVKEGQGVYCFGNGNKYHGNFTTNEMSGQGTLHFSNGDTYQGEFKQNCIEGYGTYKSRQEDSEFRGYYIKGVKHGRGELVFNGTVHHGVWKDGVYYYYD